MPRRRVPAAVLPHIGAYREPLTPTEIVLEQVGLAKEFGEGGLSDFDPMVVVMELVAEEVRALRLSARGPKGGQVWMEAMEELQQGGVILQTEHNPFLPCRTCDRSFRPQIDRQLLALFLVWSDSRAPADLVAIHQCGECGGTLTELESKSYTGDAHTPAPVFVGTDEHWAEQLLEVSGLWAAND